ncbi:MAG: hypothetical protein DWQ01_00415 [Planctomycetota bacterium]|nr:MAG: hypothetical protein DWQ01_00415 [Planctomycetota bacterium]
MHKLSRILSLSFLLIPLLAASLGAQGTVWFVDAVNGNNANGGTMINNAFQTINFAVNLAAPGDTINVLPGTYNESVYINKDGLRLEALPIATITPPGGQPAFEIVSDTTAISNATLVRGFEIVDAFYGVYIHNSSTPLPNSPTIEMNEMRDCSIGIFLEHFGSGITHDAILRYNFIHHEIEGCSAPYGAGIYLLAYDGAICETFIRANRIFYVEFGMLIDDTVSSSVVSDHQCNVLAYNEWSYFIESTAAPTLCNESIAFGAPASSTGFAYGVYSNSPNVNVYNSIIWVPDGIDCFGFPFIGDDVFGPVTVDGFSIVEDVNPAMDPQFVDAPNLDFHIFSTSPAINAGDTILILPGSTIPIDHDNDGAPRIQDPFRTGVLDVDLGAYEYATVSMDVVDPADPANSSGLPYVMGRFGGSVNVSVTGNPGDQWMFWWNTANSYGTNVVLPALGNQLVLFGINPITFTLTSSSAVLPINLPNRAPLTMLALQELEFHLQSAISAPNTSNPILGGFTRRIIVELNQ